MISQKFKKSKKLDILIICAYLHDTLEDTEATYYVDKQVFYFNFDDDNSAIVRVFPLEDYFKLDPDCKMKTYEFGIIYIRD